MNWTHDGLQADLASHLRATRDRVVWEDMQLGPSGSKRPDVYTIPKSYTQFKPLAYEIKVSVADYRSDVTSGKWQHYLEFASGVTFAVPAGLITKADLPPGCGLMVRGEDGWRTIKAPTLKATQTLPPKAWLKLVIDGIERQQLERPRREFNEHRVQRKFAQKFGENAAVTIAKLANGLNEEVDYELQLLRTRHDALLKSEKDRYDAERRRQKENRAQVDSAVALLAEALGLDSEADCWDVVHALNAARRELSRDAEIQRLTQVIKSVQRAVRGEVA